MSFRLSFSLFKVSVGLRLKCVGEIGKVVLGLRAQGLGQGMFTSPKMFDDHQQLLEFERGPTASYLRVEVFIIIMLFAHFAGSKYYVAMNS